MADLLLKICDLHSLADEQVPAQGHSIVVDGREYLIDTCDSCWPTLTLQMVIEAGRTVSKTGRPGTPTQCAEEGCGQVFDSKAQMREHVRKHHGGGEGPIPCGQRGCKRRFKSNAGKVQHWRQAHGLNKEGKAA